MTLELSDLPPDLRREILRRANLTPGSGPRRRRAPRPHPHLPRVCSCRSEIFRPDGNYPDCCDGCGERWPN